MFYFFNLTQESKKGNSYANDLEVHMCVTMLRHMHARYGIDVGKRAAIITFYAGQVEVCRPFETRDV
jgi:hypothetical protein